jgi:hypothetical protein
MKLTLSDAWLWRRVGGGGRIKRLRLRDGKRITPKVAILVFIGIRMPTLTL